MNLLPHSSGYVQTGLILAVLASSPNAYSQVIDVITEQEEVLRAWAKRKLDVQTIDACWKGRDTMLANSKRQILGKWGPKETETHDSLGRVVWDTEKTRVRIQSNRYGVDRDGGTSPRTRVSNKLSDIHCLPLRLVYDGIDRIYDMYQVSEPMFYTVGDETIDGRQCLHLRLTPDKVRARSDGKHFWIPAVAVEENFWLDKQRDYLPVRFTRTRNNRKNVRVQVDITYEERGRRFIPKFWKTGWYFREGVPSLVMNADVTKLTTNEQWENFVNRGISRSVFLNCR